jgi:hypothetical protein
MSGAIPLLPVYAFIAWTRKLLTLYASLVLANTREENARLTRDECI